MTGAPYCRHVVRRLAILLSTWGACTVEPATLDIPEADQAAFFNSAYPILLADCGFPACHGDPTRPFAVWGPGRLRLESEQDAYDPPTAEEVALSYTRARSVLYSPDGPRQAPLLRKPLAVSVGGTGHKGDDPWGQAIYQTKRDPHYTTLFYWAIGAE